MTKFLLKTFVKSDDFKSPSVRKKCGVFASITGILCNALLSALKLVAGILAGSIAIIADAVNNLTDAGSSAVNLVCFKAADKPADSRHPFGHARMEYVAGLIVSFIIIIVGIELVISSAKNIFGQTAIKTSYLTIGILCASIAVKLWMTFFYRSVARTIDSGGIKAAAQDSLNDCVATFFVLVSSVLAMAFDLQLDAYFGLGVALFIIISGIRSLKETTSPLLGEKPDRGLIKRVEDKICSYGGVLGIHDLIAHNYGPNKYFISLHVEVDYKTDILISHELIDRIEREVREGGVEVIIHLDPVDVDNPKTLRLKELVTDIVKNINSQLTLHDFRVVYGSVRNNIIFDVVKNCNLKMSDNELKDIIQEELNKVAYNCFAVINVDSNYV